MEYLLKVLNASTSDLVASKPGLRAQQEAPALINRANSNGNTALHWAALNGHLEAAKALVSAGADARVKNSAGRDAAVEAEHSGKDEVANYLLSTMADEGRIAGGNSAVEMAGVETEQRPKP